MPCPSFPFCFSVSLSVSNSHPIGNFFGDASINSHPVCIAFCGVNPLAVSDGVDDCFAVAVERSKLCECDGIHISNRKPDGEPAAFAFAKRDGEPTAFALAKRNSELAAFDFAIANAKFFAEPGPFKFVNSSGIHTQPGSVVFCNPVSIAVTGSFNLSGCLCQLHCDGFTDVFGDAGSYGELNSDP